MTLSCPFNDTKNDATVTLYKYKSSKPVTRISSVSKYITSRPSTLI